MKTVENYTNFTPWSVKIHQKLSISHKKTITAHVGAVKEHQTTCKNSPTERRTKRRRIGNSISIIQNKTAHTGVTNSNNHPTP